MKIILNLGQWFRRCCLIRLTDDAQWTKTNYINPPLSPLFSDQLKAKLWDRNKCVIFL